MSGAIQSCSINPISADTYLCGIDETPWRSVCSNEFKLSLNSTSQAKLLTHTEGTVDTTGVTQFILGNQISKGTIGNARGYMYIYNDNSNYVRIGSHSDLTGNINITFPTSGGILALQSDVDDKLPLSGGTLTGNIITHKIEPSSANTYTIGSTSKGYKNIYVDSGYYCYHDDAQYVRLYTGVVGTSDTTGIGRLILGNGTVSGTAGNATSRIDFYGTDKGYTSLTPSNNAATNAAVKLPSVSGIMPVASVSGTTLTLKW